MNAIGGMSSTQLTLEWRRLLDLHGIEELAGAIAAMTPSRTKDMLNRPEPPTIEQIELLVSVGDSHAPGVYIGLIKPTPENLRDEKSYAYTGSAARVGRGFQGRVPDHLNP